MESNPSTASGAIADPGAALSVAAVPTPTALQTFHPYIRLPQELQDIIIAYACVEEGPITSPYTYRSRSSSSSVSIKPKIPALTAVSKKLRADSLAIFFGQNTFSLKHWKAVNTWASAIRSRGVDVKSLSHVTLRIMWNDEAGRNYLTGIVEIRKEGPNEPLLVQVTGELIQKCTCELLAYAKPTNSTREPRDRVAKKQQQHVPTTGSRVLDALLEMQNSSVVRMDSRFRHPRTAKHVPKKPPKLVPATGLCSQCGKTRCIISRYTY